MQTTVTQSEDLDVLWERIPRPVGDQADRRQEALTVDRRQQSARESLGTATGQGVRHDEKPDSPATGCLIHGGRLTQPQKMK